MPQSRTHLPVHLVFSTKNRAPWLHPDIRPRVHEYLGGILRDLECPSIIVDGVDDHVHVLFVLSRKLALMNVVEEIKIGSSKWIKSISPDCSNFHWQNGYAAFSVSQSNVQAVHTYIANQEQHHTRMSFQNELRALFHKHGIDFDEQYVWD